MRKNVIVCNNASRLNELNYPDELVRHKILDVIGDMRPAGIVKCHNRGGGFGSRAQHSAREENFFGKQFLTKERYKWYWKSKTS